MRESALSKDANRAGKHLAKLVKFGSFGGLLFSLLGTAVAWAGTESFNCSASIWKTSLTLNLSVFALTWLAYLPFRNTDSLIGNGIIAALLLLDMFWMFGFGGIYFYFLCAPIDTTSRITGLAAITAILVHRGYVISNDIGEAFRKNRKLQDLMYQDEGVAFSFKRQAIGFLEKSRRNRSPFKSIHVYVSMAIAPVVFVLNKVLSPAFGDGHGFFLVMAFLAAPMILWGVELFVQTWMAMIYYPVKLQKETGKPVLLKDW